MKSVEIHSLSGARFIEVDYLKSLIFRKYPVKAGFGNWSASLKTQFPEEEHAAIDKYFKLVEEYGSNAKFQIMVKMMP